jgi:hypothetical protein
MITAPDPQPSIPFTGLRGRTLARLLQLPSVRYHRVQLGAVERPREYRRFLSSAVVPRLLALPGRLGVFGVGSHSDIVVAAAPEIADHIHCVTDNNPAHWRQQRFGKWVLPPVEAVACCDAFFLSTAVFQRVIHADLIRLGFRGPVVAVDDDVPPGWFLSSEGDR